MPSAAPATPATDMTKNMGLTDRSVRLLLAAVLAVLALFVVEGALTWVLGVLAVVLAATSAIGTCPLYVPFHLSTRR